MTTPMMLADRCDRNASNSFSSSGCNIVIESRSHRFCRALRIAVLRGVEIIRAKVCRPVDPRILRSGENPRFQVPQFLRLHRAAVYLFLPLLAIAQGTYGQTPAFVQSWGVFSPSSVNVTQTSASSVNPGDTVIVHVFCGANPCTVTVSGSRGETYTSLRGQALATDGDFTQAWCGNPTGTGTDDISVSHSGAVGLGFIAIHVTGASCTTDGINSSNTTCSSACTSGNITTTLANDFLVGLYGNTNNFSTSVALGTGWSNLGCTRTTDGAFLTGASCSGQRTITAVETQLASTAGTYAATFNASVSDETAIIVIALRASAGAGSFTASPSVTLTTSDSVGRVSSRNINVTESASVVDATANQYAFHIAKAETLTTSDAGAVGHSEFRSAAETLSTVGTVAVINGRNPIENLSTAGSVAISGVYSRGPPAESLTTSASVTATKTKQFAVNVAESLMVESLRTIDSASAQPAHLGSVTETLSHSDTATATSPRSIIVVESIATQDSVGSASPSNIAPTENLTTNSSVTCMSCVGNFSETLHTLDVVSALKNGSQSFSVTPVENLSTSGSVTARASFVRAVGEVTSSVDSTTTARALHAAAVESLTTSSGITTGGAISRTVSEALSTTDSGVGVLANPSNRGVSEALTTTASVAVRQSRSASLTESLTAVDVATAAVAHRLGLFENLTLADQVSVVVQRVGTHLRRSMVIDTP